MATIEVRGYVQKPETKTTAGGKQYASFNLGVKQKEKAYKDKPEKVTWANFRVTDWKNGTPPAEKAYVTVRGYLTVREAEINGAKRTFLEINAQEVELPESDAAEPPASTAAPKSAGPKVPEKDPWE